MSPEHHTGQLTKQCPHCWATFTATGPAAGRRVYCSDRCRRDAWNRRRYTDTQPTPPPEPATDNTPLPEPAAHRPCPHCGGLITIVALLTTPEAARPTIPAHNPDVIPLRPAQHR